MIYINNLSTAKEILSYIDNDDRYTHHTSYYHYTTLERADQIFRSNLLLFSPLAFTSNDKPEKDWYIKNDSHCYTLCLSTGTSENLPLWYLYSGIDGKGARLGFKKGTIKSICNSAAVSLYIKDDVGGRIYRTLNESEYTISARDVLYIGKDTTNKGKYRIKYSDRTKNGVDEDVYNSIKKQYNANIKGLIWAYEKETRIQIRINDNVYKEKALDKSFHFYAAVDITPYYKDISLRLAPEIQDKKEIISNHKGIMDFISNKLEFSDYVGEISMSLKKRLCDNCDQHQQ